MTTYTDMTESDLNELLGWSKDTVISAFRTDMRV